MRASAKSNRHSGRLRIVAGKWRHRLISLEAAGRGETALRPTPDRVRETLFNWLQPLLPGARVLDLFAGTGILGLEALSRGAAHATFVERDRAYAARIEENARLLGGAKDATLVCADVVRFLQGPAVPVSIVFLDPPYADVTGAADSPTSHGALCQALASGGWLADGARIYLEQGADAPPPELPAPFALLKDKRAGKVRYMLAHVVTSSA